MFAGTLTRNVETAAAQYTGMIHSTRFDIAIQLEARAKMSERSPDFDVTAVNKSGVNGGAILGHGSDGIVLSRAA